MKNSSKLVIIALCLLLTAGCASYDGPMALKGQGEADVESAITVNETTKSEVKETYGEPTSTSVGGNTWSYTLDISPHPYNLYIPLSDYIISGRERKDVTIEFNDDGVVQDVTFERMTF